MAWFKVDDGITGARKLLRIPRKRRTAAMGLWVLAGAWAARELTDGHIPAELVAEIGGTPREVEDLVSATLWTAAAEGWDFHDWADYQPSRLEVLQERAAHADRQRSYRERKKAERDAQNPESDAVTNSARAAAVTTARPDPTRPDPVVPSELPNEVQIPREPRNPEIAETVAGRRPAGRGPPKTASRHDENAAMVRRMKQREEAARNGYHHAELGGGQ